ncbi:unnamed protein product [Cyprideis torosa]|uniref:Uncharacterized protein n=1 Tax=Cyprideis torosa TaxID=163714 RepID=A0A7R8ZNW9_9CRUS|nr:unnamed protein product [Cyprideis torosa]CAG0899010.1 unnamed protein product [Cyprideis torosa]
MTHPRRAPHLTTTMDHLHSLKLSGAFDADLIRFGFTSAHLDAILKGHALDIVEDLHLYSDLIQFEDVFKLISSLRCLKRLQIKGVQYQSFPEDAAERIAKAVEGRDLHLSLVNVVRRGDSSLSALFAQLRHRRRRTFVHRMLLFTFTTAIIAIWFYGILFVVKYVGKAFNKSVLSGVLILQNILDR